MTRLLLACLAAAVAALPAPGAVASPAPGSCVVDTDATGDVRVEAATGSANVDLVAARVVATPKGITATITVAGEPKPLPVEAYVYDVFITQPEKSYQLSVRLRGGIETVFVLYEASGTFDPGAGAGTTSWREVPGATGSIDVARRSVTVTAPASALGTIRPGRTWSVPMIQGGHGLVAFYGPVDDLEPVRGRLVAGDGRCR